MKIATQKTAHQRGPLGLPASPLSPHIPRALAVTAALASGSTQVMADNCSTAASTVLTQGVCAQGPAFAKADVASNTNQLFAPASAPFTNVITSSANGTNMQFNAGTTSVNAIAGGATSSINYFINAPDSQVLFDGNAGNRLFAASRNNNYGVGNIHLQGGNSTAKRVWASYTDLQMAGTPGVRGTYSINAGAALVLDNVRMDQAVASGAGHLGVVSENAGRTFVQDTSVVMSGPAAYGFYTWANGATSQVDAARAHVATFGDGSGGVKALQNSPIRVDSSEFFSQGNQAVHAFAQNSKVFLNGNFMASGVTLGNTRLANSWTSASDTLTNAPANFYNKPDWNTFGYPVNSTGANAGRDTTQYQASAATHSNAIYASDGTGQFWLDFNAADEPNVIHMFGAGTNHALYVNGSGGANLGGTINSRGTQITTHSPQSAGAKVEAAASSPAGASTILRVDGNRVTTLADNSPAVWATGAASALSTPYTASTLITEGANSHAVQADTGAAIVFDSAATPPTFGPQADSKVSGANAAVLYADGTGSLIRLKGAPQTLQMAMTADTSGVANQGAWANTGATIAFSELANSGGTALKASAGGSLLFDGDGAASADAAGSRVMLNAGALTLAGTQVRIGSLEGDAASAVHLSGSTVHLVVGPIHAASDGSRQPVTTYAGGIAGDGAITVAAGYQLRLATTGAATHTGKTTVGGAGTAKALPTNAGASVLGAGAANVLSASSKHVVLADGALDLHGFAQTVLGLDNAGIVSLPSNTPALLAPTTVMSTTNDYTSNGGLLVLSTQLGPDGSPSDQLVVGGNVVLNTPTRIDVQNIAGVGAPAPNGILLVTVAGASPAGAFTLAHPVADNGVNYRLEQVGKNWYLRTVLAPTIITATPGNNKGVLTIAPPTNLATGVTVTSYTMTCTPTAGGAPVVLSGSSPLTMTGLSNGQTYNCQTTATLNDGTVTPTSNTMPLALTSAPVITVAMPGNGQATLTITPPGNLGMRTVTSYTMTCTPASGGPAIVATGTSPLLVPGMTNGTTYNCTTEASLSDGSKSLLSNTMPVTPPVLTPSITQTTPGDQQATVKLAPPPNLPAGVTVTNYTLTCTPANGSPAVTVTGGSSIDLSSLTNGVLYTCTTIANLSDGKPSATSAPASFTPSSTPVVPTTATPVPTLGQWALALLSGLLAVFGITGSRRKKSLSHGVDS